MKYTHEWLFKAVWRATALTFKVEAKNEKHAWKRAQTQVLRMQGARACEDIVLIRQIR